MAAPGKKGFWRKCRTCFRWCRITVWFLLFLLLCGFIYLSETGLPDFVKQPVLQTLREKGVDLEFSRLRLRWLRGIVADNVRFGKTNDPGGLRLSAERMEFGLNEDELLHFHLKVDSVSLRR